MIEIVFVLGVFQDGFWNYKAILGTLRVLLLFDVINSYIFKYISTYSSRQIKSDKNNRY